MIQVIYYISPPRAPLTIQYILHGICDLLFDIQTRSFNSYTFPVVHLQQPRPKVRVVKITQRSSRLEHLFLCISTYVTLLGDP